MGTADPWKPAEKYPSTTGGQSLPTLQTHGSQRRSIHRTSGSQSLPTLQTHGSQRRSIHRTSGSKSLPTPQTHGSQPRSIQAIIGIIGPQHLITGSSGDNSRQVSFLPDF